MTYRFYRNCQFDGPVLDALYQEAFGEKTDGLFVEVGASNGRDFSNTWGLAKGGWGGIYIEPVEELAVECAKEHIGNPRVKTICCAAGASDQPMGSAWMIPEWGTATLSREAATLISKNKRLLPCPIRRLDSILAEESWPEQYELLVIDVDFGEIEVLKGYSINRWKPRLVIIELHEQAPAWQHPFNDEIRVFSRTYFHSAGYAPVYADSINTVFRLL